MNITPDQARILLYEGHTVETPKVKEGKDGGNWQVQYHDSYWNQLPDAPYEDAVLYAAAPDLAQTVAGMTEQWRAEYREIWGAWLAASDWTTEDKARLALTPDQFKDATTRLVRRLVGPVEVAE